MSNNPYDSSDVRRGDERFEVPDRQERKTQPHFVLLSNGKGDSMQSNSMQITKEVLDLAISLNACKEGIERAKFGFEFLTIQDRMWIAEQKETPVSFLEIFSTDENEFVRSRVTRNPSTPVSVLEKLSTDEDSWVRYYVAHNPSTPVSVLEKLSTDKHEVVRCNVAENHSTPAFLLEKLSTDEVCSVRECVANNPSTPASILEKLSTDEDSWVRSYVVGNPTWIAYKKAV